MDNMVRCYYLNISDQATIDQQHQEVIALIEFQYIFVHKMNIPSSL